ncbi:hypothetical protein DVH24_006635 [Malus domestica]|uniref:Uncharacterized protein n=1 Tax=Malus domestica TaxID=3750 RepID=A0A498KCV6_MALDO|nr:hypothetical protein DVH24_006635 [Malus domestica]
METYKPMLEECKDVCEQLERKPLWSLIKLYINHFLVITKRNKKFDTDLIKFRIGDCDSRGITPDDVALIFGLPNVDKSSKSGKRTNSSNNTFIMCKISHPVTVICKLWLIHHMELLANLCEVKGVRDYLFKMIDRSQTNKRKRGDESTTSGCTVLILYWICLKSNLVATIEC